MQVVCHFLGVSGKHGHRPDYINRDPVGVAIRSGPFTCSHVSAILQSQIPPTPTIAT